MNQTRASAVVLLAAVSAAGWTSPVHGQEGSIVNAEPLRKITGAHIMLSIGESFVDSQTGAIAAVSNYAYDSNASTIINSFQPLLPVQKRVESIFFIISGRTGSYGAGYLVSFEVRDLFGNLLRTVSAAPIDLEAASQLTLIDVPLSPDLANRWVRPGEYLAAHVYPAAGPGGDLSLRGHFQAYVR